MGLERGVFEVQEPVDPVTHIFVTKKGEVAFKIVISRAVVGRYGWILKLLQRRVLDAVDPPLEIVGTIGDSVLERGSDDGEEHEGCENETGKSECTSNEERVFLSLHVVEPWRHS